MALKGHKKGCGCVGCSPATRKRGMSALKKYSGKHKHRRENPYVRVKYKARTTKLWRVKRSGKWGGFPKHRNPPMRKSHAGCSHREVTIYAKFLPFKIYAIKGVKSFYPGQRFQHQFKAGGRVSGLPDGSIRLYPAAGKRLWSMIPQRGK